MKMSMKAGCSLHRIIIALTQIEHISRYQLEIFFNIFQSANINLVVELYLQKCITMSSMLMTFVYSWVKLCIGCTNLHYGSERRLCAMEYTLRTFVYNTVHKKLKHTPIQTHTHIHIKRCTTVLFYYVEHNQASHTVCNLRYQSPTATFHSKLRKR